MAEPTTVPAVGAPYTGGGVPADASSVSSSDDRPLPPVADSDDDDASPRRRVGGLDGRLRGLALDAAAPASAPAPPISWRVPLPPGAPVPAGLLACGILASLLLSLATVRSAPCDAR